MAKITLYVPHNVEAGTVWMETRIKAKEHNLSLSKYVQLALSFANKNAVPVKKIKDIFSGD